MIHYFRKRAKGSFVTLVMFLTLAGVILWNFKGDDRPVDGSMVVNHEIVSKGQLNLYTFSKQIEERQSFNAELYQYLLTGQFVTSMGFTPVPSDVKAKVTELFGSTHSPKETVDRYLQINGATAIDLRAILQRDDIIDQWHDYMQPATADMLVSKRVTEAWQTKLDVEVAWLHAKDFSPDSKSKMADNLAKAFYEAHQGSWLAPTLWQVEYIMLDQSALKVASKEDYAQALEKVDSLALTEPSSLQGIVAGYPVHSAQTDWFDLEHPKLGWLKQAEVKSAILAPGFKQGFNSHVVELNDNKAVVLRLVAVKPGHQRSFEEVKPDIDKLVKKQQQRMALYQALAKRLYTHPKLMTWNPWLKAHGSHWLSYKGVESYDGRLEASILAAIQDWLMAGSTHDYNEVRAVIMDDDTVAVIRLRGATHQPADKDDMTGIYKMLGELQLNELFSRYIEHVS